MTNLQAIILGLIIGACIVMPVLIVPVIIFRKEIIKWTEEQGENEPK